MDKEQLLLNHLEAHTRKLDRIDTALRGDLEHVGLIARVELIESEIEKGPKVVARMIGVVSLVVTILMGIFALIIKTT